MAVKAFSHKAYCSGVISWTFKPCLTMDSMASPSLARVSSRKRTPASAEAFVRACCWSGERLFQALEVMTVAPTRGAQRIRVIWGARGNHWKERAERGVVSKE